MGSYCYDLWVANLSAAWGWPPSLTEGHSRRIWCFQLLLISNFISNMVCLTVAIAFQLQVDAGNFFAFTSLLDRTTSLLVSWLVPTL
jgi:hypothetical protein